MRQLASLNYTFLTTDREAGLIKAEKKTTSIGKTLLTTTTYFNEVTVFVLPATVGSESTLRLRIARSRQEGRGARTSSGLLLTSDIKKDGAAIEGGCR